MASVINQIKLGDTEYAIAASAFAECATKSSTQAKVATICTGGNREDTAFTLVMGVSLQVSFPNGDSSPAGTIPTLNVNDTGAKPILYRFETIGGKNLLKPYGIYTFVYNGSEWELVGEINNDADTKNTAGSTDTDSKIFLVGAKNQAANPQTYSHSEVYVDTDHFLTDTAGFRTGSSSSTDCTEYKNKAVKITDGTNTTISTFNFPTTANGNFTVATQEWVETHPIGQIAWSEDLITNKVDLSGATINFDTAAGESAFTIAGIAYFTSSNGYSLHADFENFHLTLKQGGNIKTSIFDIQNGWFVDSITLPDDFGYITLFGNSSVPVTATYALETLNNIAPDGVTVVNGNLNTKEYVDYKVENAASTHTHGNIANDGTLGTASRVVITDANKKITPSTVTTTELGYLSGVTSNIQTQLAGKAASSHGTHVSYSATTPKANGTASVGTATTVSRSDHVHPTDTTRAPTSHASTATTYGLGTTTNYGHVKISNGDVNTVASANGLAAGMDHSHGNYMQKTAFSYNTTTGVLTINTAG